jgi:hypothetical protein
MVSFEAGQREMLQIATEARSGAPSVAAISESDTRAKLIDRMLTQVLGWEESQIKREPNVESGYVDYVLSCPHAQLVVEAKRIGVSFSLPLEKKNRRYVLRGMSSEGSDVGAAIRQARRYCDDLGVEFGCVSNGHQWIVFHAITRGSPWLDSRAVVFRSLDDICDNFVDFWNTISVVAVKSKSLASAFGNSVRTRPEFVRPIRKLGFAESPLERNFLSPQMQPVIDALFRDLTGWRDSDVLRSCYVWEKETTDAKDGVTEAVVGSLPEIRWQRGFSELVTAEHSNGEFGSAFYRAVDQGKYGTTILLLGKIGSGKTTLLQRLIGSGDLSVIRDKAAVVYVPFTDAPPDPVGVKSFVRRKVLEELKAQHPDVEWKSYELLKQVYARDIDEHRNGIWKMLPESAVAMRESALLQSSINAENHADRVLKWLRSIGAAVVVVIDNMDHHSPSQQETVFLHAHALSRDFDAIVIVALREETFFRGLQTGSFNAYSNIRYQISPPNVRSVLRKRIEYVLRCCEQGSESLQRLCRSDADFDVESIGLFLEQAHLAMREQRIGNPAIASLLDSLSDGNMREALELFGLYLVSGATKVEHILKIVKASGMYRIAEHEFIKAIMLGDFQYYRDSRSHICNVFDVTSGETASNLTAIRLLRYLHRRSGVAHAEGHSFVDIDAVLRDFERVFGDSEDVKAQIERLLQRRLVDVDTRSPSTISGAKAVQINRRGRYYLTMLCRRFQYAELVSLDTPICLPAVQQRLEGFNQSTMIHRMSRAELLFAYLRYEETRSLEGCSIELAEAAFGTGIVDELFAQYSNGVEDVRSRTDVSRDELLSIRADAEHLVAVARR